MAFSILVSDTKLFFFNKIWQHLSLSALCEKSEQPLLKASVSLITPMHYLCPPWYSGCLLYSDGDKALNFLRAAAQPIHIHTSAKFMYLNKSNGGGALDSIAWRSLSICWQLFLNARPSNIYNTIASSCEIKYTFIRRRSRRGLLRPSSLAPTDEKRDFGCWPKRRRTTAGGRALIKDSPSTPDLLLPGNLFRDRIKLASSEFISTVHTGN